VTTYQNGAPGQSAKCEQNGGDETPPSN